MLRSIVTLFFIISVATIACLSVPVQAQGQEITVEQYHTLAIKWMAEALVIQKSCPDASSASLMTAALRLYPTIGDNPEDNDKGGAVANDILEKYASFNNATMCSALALQEDYAAAALRKLQ